MYSHSYMSVYNFLNRVLTIDVPEIIVVEDIPSTPPPPVSSRDITSAIRRHSASLTMTSWTEPETPTTRRDDQFELSDLTPTIGGGGGGSSLSRGLRRDRRLSDMSAVSADLGLRHTYVFGSCVFVDRVDRIFTPTRLDRRELSLFRDSSYPSEDYDQDVVASVQNSAWGGE